MNQEVQADKKDIQFRVLEPPRMPLSPIGPDRFRLNTMVLLGALGFGFAAPAYQILQSFEETHIKATL